MTARAETAVRREVQLGSAEETEWLLGREWLVTNGLGGYASGTVSGVPTRRYHGLLIAALPNPLGRVVMLNQLIEYVTLADGTAVQLGADERAGPQLEVPGLRHLTSFRLESGLPVWEYRVGDVVIEKRVIMPHRQNTVMVVYRLLEGTGPVSLELRPAVHFRKYEAPVGTPMDEGYRLAVAEGHYVLSAGRELPGVRIVLYDDAPTLTVDEQRPTELLYRQEMRRGYDSVGHLWSPGYFTLGLRPGRSVAFVASAEMHEVMTALHPEDALVAEKERRRRLLEAAPRALRAGVAAELVLAADQFVITPAGRTVDAVRAWAMGDDVRTVIAGYHWFTDWGRDTMISLEGLTLTTGRHRDAGSILRTFSHYVRGGLIPNMFPDGSDEGLYHTADATLWFFHAIDRYVQITGNCAMLRLLLPTLTEIIEHHRRGTRFGIGMDPKDALLRQGAEGYQLTWMDAKVGDWVVTPRRGKAVEINALWYNALRLMESWVGAERGLDAAAPYAELAARAHGSFNERFWYAEGGYCYDVVDGPDGPSPACRPNQVLAISLRHPVLDPSRWPRVLEVVRERLLTPVGLRSLAPGSIDYKPRYDGDLRARDAAYHQGTVWAWLIGPWVDAWLRVHPHDRAGARRFLTGLVEHLDDFGVGSIAEVFDAEAPYTARGAIAQAWSVAEELRCWLKTAEGDDPTVVELDSVMPETQSIASDPSAPEATAA